ncbi:50S ribosomal protein L25 [Symbiobacterium thermophilum IAM 14863]|uniref:Large ribosomal subunit protein bL25B n=2 Tax=Symbiobacterium thermophilum TaxID=2734 RepID=RL252_SYMTH|nr:RecName: Full=Large ribosomal subunit protein bL25B; AltName: Full=50S ribosomal protein L25 2; AltName: Full=General stress protein CTC 2 [Symbiobacterium thermophilum IAM 14863]BAD41279.1 50S ribosomal protein L25 [Symbiobacterium thermophilum IAM 14863]
MQLEATPRGTGSRASRRLRQAGFVPGIIYGPGVEPLAVSVRSTQLERLVERQGRGHLIHVQVEGEANPRQVVIKQLQRDILTQQVTHVDFLQVDMNRTITLTVPIVVVGEEQARRRGLLITHELDEVEVECRPTEIPEAVTLDVSGLTEPGPVTAASLSAPPGVRVLEDPDTVVVSCTVIGGGEEEEASTGPAA